MKRNTTDFLRLMGTVCVCASVHVCVCVGAHKLVHVDLALTRGQSRWFISPVASMHQGRACGEECWQLQRSWGTHILCLSLSRKCACAHTHTHIHSHAHTVMLGSRLGRSDDPDMSGKRSQGPTALFRGPQSLRIFHKESHSNSSRGVCVCVSREMGKKRSQKWETIQLRRFACRLSHLEIPCISARWPSHRKLLPQAQLHRLCCRHYIVHTQPDPLHKIYAMSNWANVRI